MEGTTPLFICRVFREPASFVWSVPVYFRLTSGQLPVVISVLDSTQNLSKSTSNLRPFQDETKLNETPSLSLHNLALGDYPQPSPAEANQHHADLLEDLAEKSKIIEKLESEIDTLRTELEETRDQLDRALQGAPPSGKSSNGVSPREPKKSVHSLLEDLSERENQIYEKVWVKKITAFISRTQLIKKQVIFTYN